MHKQPEWETIASFGCEGGGVRVLGHKRPDGTWELRCTSNSMILDENDDGFVDTQVITNAPELTGAIRGNFDFPVGGGLITASIGYAYRDESMLTNDVGADPRDPTGQTPLEPLIQPSFGLLDAWIAWLSPEARWRIGLSAKNLTDEEYLLTGYNLPVFGVVTGSYGAPLTIIGTVEFRFW